MNQKSFSITGNPAMERFLLYVGLAGANAAHASMKALLSGDPADTTQAVLSILIAMGVQWRGFIDSSVIKQVDDSDGDGGGVLPGDESTKPKDPET